MIFAEETNKLVEWWLTFKAGEYFISLFICLIMIAIFIVALIVWGIIELCRHIWNNHFSLEARAGVSSYDDWYTRDRKIETYKKEKQEKKEKKGQKKKKNVNTMRNVR